MLDEMVLDQRNLEAKVELHRTPREQQGCRNDGPSWTCANSITEGCSLSLLATAALSTVRARVLEAEIPAVLCNSIVDDRRPCATGKISAKTTASSHPDHTRLRHDHGDKIQSTRGERSTTNYGPVWDASGELRETNRAASHVQRKQRQKEPRQPNGCSNEDSRKNPALAQGLQLRRPWETHRDERHPKVPLRDRMRIAE